MKMKTGPKLKGKAVPATQGKSRNQPEHLKVQTKGAMPTVGGTRTKNHPNVSPSPRAEIGKGVPNSYYANSRSDVHPAFNTSKKHD
jgi:hypothetical protein